MSRTRRCPLPRLKKGKRRKGLCSGSLVLEAVNARPGWSTYRCQTCGRTSERNDSK